MADISILIFRYIEILSINLRHISKAYFNIFNDALYEVSNKLD